MEFDKLTNHAVLTENLGDAESEVSRGYTFGKFPVEVYPDHFRNKKGHRLAKHPGLCLNTTDTPSDDTNTIDHRGVRISSDECVGIINAVLIENALGKVFEIHLVNDSDAGRHDGKRIKGLLTPLEKFIALAVADELDFHVAIESSLRSGEVYLHRVINNQINRHERLDFFRGSSTSHRSVAHRSNIDKKRHSGKIL